MSRYVNTLGRGTLAVGICDRCRRKFPLMDLVEDPNAPGLRVCTADRDVLDPYLLPPREDESIQLDFARPDEPLT